MNVNQCSSCGAPIVWAKTAKDERMPVDVEPDTERGNVLLTGRAPHYVAGVLSKGQAAGARAAGTVVHTSHFATCPFADGHRSQAKRARRR